MTTLADVCEDFCLAAEEDDGARLRALTLKLARDAVEHLADTSMGEVAAILERARDLLVAIDNEAEVPGDRHHRHVRRAAELNLLTLCDAVARHGSLTSAQRRRKGSDADLRRLVSAALAGHVEKAE